MIILDMLFWIFVFIILMSLFIYPIIIDLLTKNRKNKQIKQTPPVTIIIPTLNEEKNIEKKIKNLLKQGYPKNKIIIFVVDNGSADNTVKIAKKFPVSILYSERGKLNAINRGLKNAKTDIVVVTDADVEISANAIKSLVSYLHNGIGAVSGFTLLKGNKSQFYMKGKLDYHKNDWNLRHKESLLDSACSLDGKLMAFRKSIISQLPKGLVCDDYLLTLLIRKKGYRCVISKEALIYENAPPALDRELKQIRRRGAIGGIYLSLKFSNFLFNGKYSYFGALIFPFRRFFVFLFPIFIAYILAYLIALSVKLTLVLAILAILYIIAFRKYYMLLQLYGLFLAWCDFLTGKAASNKIWVKT